MFLKICGENGRMTSSGGKGHTGIHQYRNHGNICYAFTILLALTRMTIERAAYFANYANKHECCHTSMNAAMLARGRATQC